MADTDTAVNSADTGEAQQSFADVLAAEASPASASSPQATDATAAVQPASGTEATPQQDDARSAFIPRARFDEVNTDRNTLKTWKEQYQWAEGLDREAVSRAQEMGQRYAQDRAGFVRQILTEAMSDPDLAPAVRSEAARLLGTRQPAPGPDLSGVVLDLGNGQSIPLAELRAQWEAAMMEKLAPVVQTTQQFQQLQQQAIAQAHATSFASEFATNDLAKLPHFSELRSEIYEALKTAKLGSDHPAEVKAATYQIYIQKLAEKVLPKLSASAQSQLLDSLQQKAAASSSVNPTSAAPTTGKRITSFKDIPADQW
jgi:hypothetical protein